MLPTVGRVIEMMAEAVLVVDQRGVVVAANRAMAGLLTLTDRPAAHRPLDAYGELIQSWHVDGEPLVPTKLARALDGETIPRQFATLTVAGVEHSVEFTVAPIEDERGRVALAMLVVSDRTPEQRSRAYWKAVATAAKGISDELDVGPVLAMVLDQIVESLGAQVVIGVWRLDGARETLELVASRGTSPESEAEIRFIPLGQQSFVTEAVQTRETRCAEDTRAALPMYELDRRIIAREDLGSWVVAPLVVGRSCLGAIAYGLHVAHRFYPEDREAIVAVSGLFAEAIERADLYTEVREVNERLIVSGLRSQQTAEEAERQYSHLSALVEGLSEGVTIVNTLGNTVLTNSAGRRRTGLHEGALTLGDYHALDVRRLDGSPMPWEERPLAMALRGESFAEYEVALIRSGREECRLVFGGNSVRDQAGKVLLAIVVFRDVTRLRTLEREREDTLRSVSHDLRNPLTIIYGQAQLLVRLEQGSTRVRQSAETIATSSRRMNAMIQEIVDSARMESGGITLSLGPLDLSTTIADLIRRLDGTLDVRRVRVEDPPELPLVLGDPDRLERVLVNLLSNALKYSDPGTDVRLGLARVSDEIVVRVADEGPGISPEELPRIFERYYRSKSAVGRAEGLGLGLYVARGLVEAHHGRIWAESEVGKGSIFSFSLPLA